MEQLQTLIWVKVFTHGQIPWRCPNGLRHHPSAAHVYDVFATIILFDLRETYDISVTISFAVIYAVSFMTKLFHFRKVVYWRLLQS